MESHRNWRTERPGYIEPERPFGRLARPLQSDCRIALGRQSEHLTPPHPDNRSLQSCQPYCNPESHLNSIAIAESHRNWCTEQPGYIEPGQPVGRLVHPLRRDCRIALSLQSSCNRAERPRPQTCKTVRPSRSTASTNSQPSRKSSRTGLSRTYSSGDT